MALTATRRLVEEFNDVLRAEQNLRRTLGDLLLAAEHSLISPRDYAEQKRQIEDGFMELHHREECLNRRFNFTLIRGGKE